MIHRIPDLEAAAREIRRVLRPGAPVRETCSTGLAELLTQADTLRRADTTMPTLTEEEFPRGTQPFGLSSICEFSGSVARALMAS